MKKVSKIIQVAAGANHTIMLDADGNVWSTGYNSSGQLGIGNTDIQVQPKQMTSVSGVKRNSSRNKSFNNASRKWICIFSRK